VRGEAGAWFFVERCSQQGALIAMTKPDEAPAWSFVAQPGPGGMSGVEARAFRRGWEAGREAAAQWHTDRAAALRGATLYGAAETHDTYASAIRAMEPPA
jgi:hypothetical protein